MAQKLTADMVDEKLKRAQEHLQPVAFSLRETIEAMAPRLTAISAWSFVCYCGTDRIFSIIPYKNWVNLQFWHGAALEDPDDMIDGTGKSLRHVKCRTMEDAASPALHRLMSAAIAFDNTLETGVKI